MASLNRDIPIHEFLSALQGKLFIYLGVLFQQQSNSAEVSDWRPKRRNQRNALGFVGHLKSIVARLCYTTKSKQPTQPTLFRVIWGHFDLLVKGWDGILYRVVSVRFVG